ncbi:tol-pal system YbgF family protein [Bacteriovorax sp. Seq25_V]|uniref:tetratricopeptide repeat protein n=1 Tax=Bacteriovorax sp. Seq25_V TaxID=1201288 RepID=UPI000389E3B8|nr:tetratricopeptide repeat protein [Bacteriovorax sp. Seq25_V]EQC47268.1 tetratricopeptide repeat protein [Bacteriovorax sp. Seq25_V]
MKKIISLSLLVLIATSCKTQEQIKREQLINSMSVQMSQGQKLTADVTVKLQNLEERMQEFQGVLEETGHSKNETTAKMDERIKALEEIIKTLTTQVNDQNVKMTSIETRLADQDKFIKEILGTLKSASAPKKKLNEYDEAMSIYGKGKYSEAKPLLEALLASNKYKSSKRARILHNLGMVSYITKNNQDAMTYFSRLYTEHSSSTYNANGLIHLARTFDRLGQKEQAKQTLQEMIAKFPKHKRVKTAKEMLSKL